MFDNDPQRLLQSDRRLEAPDPFEWEGSGDRRVRKRDIITLTRDFRELERERPLDCSVPQP